MKSFSIAAAVLLAGGATVAVAAPAPPPATFVGKAGASDMFEIESAKLMTGSSDPRIKSFAQKMIADHTKSTAEVKSAAKSDGLTPKPPMLDAKQKSDLAALKAAPAGKKRDGLYIQQQKASHAEALALMQGYAAGGTAAHLKTAAGGITPVVQSHVDMLGSMPSM